MTFQRDMVAGRHTMQLPKNSVKVTYILIYLVFYVTPSTLSVILGWVVGRAEETSTYTSGHGSVL